MLYVFLPANHQNILKLTSNNFSTMDSNSLVKLVGVGIEMQPCKQNPNLGLYLTQGVNSSLTINTYSVGFDL